MDKIKIKNYLNYYYIIYKINIFSKKKKIKKKLEKSNLLYLIKISIYLGYFSGKNIFLNFEIFYYYLKFNRHVKLIIYKIKNNFIINLIKF